MMKMNLARLAIQLAFLGCVLSQELISNGDFESNLDHWTVVVPGAMTIELAVDGEGGVPINQLAQNSSNVLVTFQDDPSHGVAYQEFTAPAGASSIIIDFQYWYSSDAGIVIQNGTLDIDNNQQFRIDLLEGDNSSDPFTMASIHKQLFVTEVEDIGDDWVQFHEEVAVTEGQNYTLRFAVVVYFAPLYIGVDNVNVTAVFPPPPTTSEEPTTSSPESSTEETEASSEGSTTPVPSSEDDDDQEAVSAGNILKEILALTVLLSALFFV